MSIKKKIVWLPYDMDTAIGINNSGLLVFSYNLEDTDLQQGGEFIFNGQDSVMWTNLRDAFGNEIKAMYQQLRSSGALSYDRVEQMFETHQAKWSEAIFNEDAFYKYIEPLTNPDAGKQPDASYLPMAQGSKAEQRKWWLFNRFRYMDSKWNAGDALTDYIMMRAYAVDDQVLTPYADIYLTTSWDGELTQVRATRGQTYTLPCPKDTANDAVVAIYSASQLSSVGDLSGLKIKSGNFSMATKLQSLKIGDNTEGYSNTNLTDLQLGNNTLLSVLDVRNCPNLTQTVDLRGCSNIEEVYFDGTSITAAQLPNGGILRVLHLPDTVTNLTLRNQQNITDFTLNDYSLISTLRLENCGDLMDEAVDIVNDMQTGNIRLVGIDWDFDDGSDFKTTFNKIDTCGGIDDTDIGFPTAVAQLQGAVHTPMASSAYFNTLQSRYPYVTFTADELTNMVKQLLEGTLTEYVDDEVETVSVYAFYGITSLTNISVPNAVTINDSAFNGCTNITNANLTSAITIKHSGFYGCTKLENINAPEVTTLGYAAFYNCKKLKHISFPKLTSAPTTEMFRYANELEWADLGSVGAIGNQWFENCYNLAKLFLRKTGSVTTLSSASPLTKTPFSGYNGLVGTAYVPSALISTYQSATNWVTLYTNGTCVFKALENYTLDGTTTGEINWTKIRAEEVSA